MDEAVRVGQVVEPNLKEPLPRIYLTGRIYVEHGSAVRDETSLPSRQGRLLFCFLVLNQTLPLARHDLVSAVWGESLPEAVDELC